MIELNRPEITGGRAFPMISKRTRRLLVKYIIITILFTGAVGENYYAYVTGQRITTPLYGAWEVEDYQVMEFLALPMRIPLSGDWETYCLYGD